MRIRLSATMVVSLVLAACASTPGAKPHDMSASQHDAMARQAEQSSTTHLTQYDPSAAKSETRCGARGGCWTSVVNPTEEHRKIAEQFTKAAADHRVASQALRNAEAQTCFGLDDSDRDVSPFAHREDIASVQPAETHVLSGRNYYGRVDGAIVTFRAVPGMTEQWLQRVVDCHIARNAAMGHDAPEMAFCPLAVKGVTAEVASARGGFTVTIHASESPETEEVLRRARALVSR